MVHLFDVAAAKLFPTRGIVPEPFTKFCTWRYLLHPLIESGFLLRDSARPQPVDQKPGAVLRAGDSYARFSFTLAGGTFVLISLLAANNPFAYP
jgi:hypothetical protein